MEGGDCETRDENEDAKGKVKGLGEFATLPRSAESVRVEVVFGFDPGDKFKTDG